MKPFQGRAVILRGRHTISRKPADAELGKRDRIPRRACEQLQKLWEAGARSSISSGSLAQDDGAKLAG